MVYSRKVMTLVEKEACRLETEEDSDHMRMFARTIHVGACRNAY